MLARAAIRPTIQATRAVALRRGAHYENTVYNNMPFDYRNKTTFAIKMIAFLGTGFGLPFFAAWWQLSKQGGQ